jgi:putative nucleotidyltransferase with HDIG domain
MALSTIWPRRARWPRVAAVAAVGLGGAAAVAGATEVAIAGATLGLASLAVGARADEGFGGEHGLELVRSIAGRAAAAERLEGTLAIALEGLTVGARATGAAALVRRSDSALCDAYSWIQGQLTHEELLWPTELPGSPADVVRQRPHLPTRLGRPRDWLARPIVSHGEVNGHLIVADPAPSSERWLAAALATVGAHLGALASGERVHERLERGYVATIETLIGALEAKDSYTAGHSTRVAQYAAAIAAELGLPDDQRAELHTGAMLHDIGKIGVGDSVLLKPTRLSEAEFDQIKDHPRRGARIIDAFNRSPTVLAVVFHHHERYDGRGYPAGLRGVDIPLSARIVNVADAYDAMTTSRPYGSTRTTAEALAELERGAGSQFDPQVVGALVRARQHGRL